MAVDIGCYLERRMKNFNIVRGVTDLKQGVLNMKVLTYFLLLSGSRVTATLSSLVPSTSVFTFQTISSPLRRTMGSFWKILGTTTEIYWKTLHTLILARIAEVVLNAINFPLETTTKGYQQTRCSRGGFTNTFVIQSVSDPFPPNLQDIINLKPLELGS